MRRSIPFLALAVLAVGCGGGGGGGSSEPSPYAGTFSGPWTSTDLGQSGTTRITIATNGNVVGTIRNNTEDLDGSVSGSLSNSGSFNGTVNYPGLSSSSIRGTMAFNGSGQLTGTLIQRLDGEDYNATFTLSRE